MALLAASVTLNIYLFNTSQQYYLQLNGVRLDPLGTGLFAGEAGRVARPETEGDLIVFFGDSRAAAWPMPSIAGFEAVNLGVGSQTSAQIIQRYEAQVAPLRPEVLVVQMCINDLKTIPLFPQLETQIIRQCQENLAQLVTEAREQGTTVVLTTIFPVGESPLERRLYWSEAIPQSIDEVNGFIHSLAGEGVVVFDAFAILADENGRLAAPYRLDELHLNPAGYEALNREFVEVLQSLQ